MGVYGMGRALINRAPYPKHVPSNWQDQIISRGTSYLIHDFQTDITALSGTVEYDTSVFYSGVRSLKITTSTETGNGSARITLPAAIDMTDSYFTIWANRVSARRASRIDFQLWGAEFVELGKWSRTYGGPTLLRPNSWQLVTFTNSWNAALTEDVKYIDIVIHNDVLETPVTVCFNLLNRVPSPAQGTCVITLDGAYSSQFTDLKPLLDARSMPACVMVAWPDTANLTQLHDAYDDGWDISTHSGSTLVTDMDEATLKAFVAYRQKWLSNNGFDVRKGARYMCALQNQWDEKAVTVLSRYMWMLRTGAGGMSLTTSPQHTSLPILAYNTIPDFGANATYEQQEHLILNAIAHKYLAVITWHQPGREGELSLAQMEDILDIIDASNMRVVTMSTIIDELLL